MSDILNFIKDKEINDKCFIPKLLELTDDKDYTYRDDNLALKISSCGFNTYDDTFNIVTIAITNYKIISIANYEKGQMDYTMANNNLIYYNDDVFNIMMNGELVYISNSYMLRTTYGTIKYNEEGINYGNFFPVAIKSANH